MSQHDGRSGSVASNLCRIAISHVIVTAMPWYHAHASKDGLPVSLILVPLPLPSPQTDVRTKPSTISAIANDAVKPGLSMPMRLTKPSTGMLMSKSEAP